MSNSTEQSLIVAINCAPDQDAPRRAYADFLELSLCVRGEQIAFACSLVEREYRETRYAMDVLPK